MRYLITLVMLAGCSTYFGDDDIAPDADAAPVVDCGETLPTCAELECTGAGAKYLECRTDDTSVCYCNIPPNLPTTHPLHPGWCFNR